jgi:hypothetical protein
VSEELSRFLVKKPGIKATHPIPNIKTRKALNSTRLRKTTLDEQVKRIDKLIKRIQLDKKGSK